MDLEMGRLDRLPDEAGIERERGHAEEAAEREEAQGADHEAFSVR
jgi:hypothetical protein